MGLTAEQTDYSDFVGALEQLCRTAPGAADPLGTGEQPAPPSGLRLDDLNRLVAKVEVRWARFMLSAGND
jgi:hypothetical protein